MATQYISDLTAMLNGEQAPLLPTRVQRMASRDGCSSSPSSDCVNQLTESTDRQVGR